LGNRYSAYVENLPPRGTAGNVSENPSIVARRDGIVEMDEVRTITSEDENGNTAEVVVSRSTEFRLVADNESRTPLMVANVPYGSIYL
jgi:DNA-directed RNA polymerase subunit beta'